MPITAAVEGSETYSQACWHEIPTGVLHRVLEELEPEIAAGLCPVALTCRSWRGAVLSLIGDLEVFLANPVHIDSFCTWFQRHCSRTRRLKVTWQHLVPQRERRRFWQQLAYLSNAQKLTHVSSGSVLTCMHSPMDYGVPGYCNEVLAALQQLPGLQHLDFLQEWQCNSEWGISSGMLVHLADCLPGLRSLHVKVEWQYPCDTDIVQALPCLSALTALSLRDAYVADPNCLAAALAPLAPSLAALHLSLKGRWLEGQPRKSNQALHHLNALTTLTALTLHDCDLTDEAPLDQLPTGLVVLDLQPYSTICFGGPALAALGKLPRLMSLRLGEREWLPLEAACQLSSMTQLTRLQVPGCGLPRGAAAAAAAVAAAADGDAGLLAGAGADTAGTGPPQNLGSSSTSVGSGGASSNSSPSSTSSAGPAPLVPQILAGLTNLVDLDLPYHLNQGLGDQGLACLSVLTRLTALRVAYGGLSAAAADTLLLFTRLRLLDLSANAIGSSGVAALAAGLHQLRQLQLSYVGLQEAWALEVVAQQLQGLTHLDLASNGGIPADGFGTLTALRDLRVLVTSPPAAYTADVVVVLQHVVAAARSRPPSGFVWSWGG